MSEVEVLEVTDSATSQVLGELGIDNKEQEELVAQIEELKETPVEELVVEQEQVIKPVSETSRETLPEEILNTKQQEPTQEPPSSVVIEQVLDELGIDPTIVVVQQEVISQTVEELKEVPIEQLVVTEEQVEIPITEEKPKKNEEPKPPSSIVVEQVLEEFGIDASHTTDDVKQHEKLAKKEEILKEIPIEELTKPEAVITDEIDHEDILEKVLAETEFLPKKNETQSRPTQPTPTHPTSTQPTPTQTQLPQQTSQTTKQTPQTPQTTKQTTKQTTTPSTPKPKGRETEVSYTWYIVAAAGIAAVGIGAYAYMHSKQPK